MSSDDHLQVVDSLGHGNTLLVIVRDGRDGYEYRVSFHRNIMGQYKHDGGGGYKPWREDTYDAAVDLAKDYIRDELNSTVLPRSQWTWVKPQTAASILEDSDEYRVERVGDDDE